MRVQDNISFVRVFVSDLPNIFEGRWCLAVYSSALPPPAMRNVDFYPFNHATIFERGWRREKLNDDLTAESEFVTGCYLF